MRVNPRMVQAALANLHRKPRPSSSDSFIWKTAGPGVERTPADREIVQGEACGHVVPEKRWARRKYGLIEYSSQCKCGRKAHFTASDLLFRRRYNTGCLAPGCDFTPYYVRVFIEPKDALWIQLVNIRSKMPESLDDRWGGSAFGVLATDPLTGHDNLVNDVWDDIDVK